jgi:hypothetical protein
MLSPAFVKDADDQLARACAAVARLGDGASADEQIAVNDVIFAVTEASRMLMELTGLQAPPTPPLDNGPPPAERFD